MRHTTESPSLARCAALIVGVVTLFGILEGVGRVFEHKFLDYDVLWCTPIFNVLLLLPMLVVGIVLVAIIGKWRAVLAVLTAFTLLRFYDAGRQYVPAAGRTGSLLSVLLLTGLLIYLVHRLRAPLLRHAPVTFVTGVSVAALLMISVLTSEYVTYRAKVKHLPESKPGAPNVLIIIADTVRADHLSTYGYSRDTTPYLSRLAAEGVMFDNAIAPSSWTLPSHASMMTGRYPAEIGMQTQSDVLRSDIPTVGEAFQKKGYVTGAFSANYTFFARHDGLARGFLHFEDYVHGPAGVLNASALTGRLMGWVRTAGWRIDIVGRQRALDINRNALSWIDGSARGKKPFFAVLNYLDAHDPYMPPKQYQNLFGSGDTAGGVSIQFNQFPQLDFEHLQGEMAAYDASLRYIDDSVQDLLRQLSNRGLLENTIVVFTADHGEAFGEHHILTHANSLYREEIRVPLIVWAPKRVPANVKVEIPVSTVDLPATVLSLADVNSRFEGQPLQSLWTGSANTAQWPSPWSDLAQLKIDPSFPNYWGPIRTVVLPEFQYIRGPKGVEVYDWKSDPAEAHNIEPPPAMLPKAASERLYR